MLILSAVRRRCSRLLWHDENFESADEGRVAAVKDKWDIAGSVVRLAAGNRHEHLEAKFQFQFSVNIIPIFFTVYMTA
jgi:hypothetical protein